MYDMDDIANAIAAALEPLSSDGIGCQAVPAMPANPTPPGAYVTDGEVTYDLAMARGLDEFTMEVTLLTGYGSDLAAQRRLRKLKRPGAGGVKALIEGTRGTSNYRTLGGLVDHATVTKVTAPRLYGNPEAGKRALGCQFTVQIYATP